MGGGTLWGTKKKLKKKKNNSGEKKESNVASILLRVLRESTEGEGDGAVK